MSRCPVLPPRDVALICDPMLLKFTYNVKKLLTQTWSEQNITFHSKTSPHYVTEPGLQFNSSARDVFFAHCYQSIMVCKNLVEHDMFSDPQRF